MVCPTLFCLITLRASGARLPAVRCPPSCRGLALPASWLRHRRYPLPDPCRTADLSTAQVERLDHCTWLSTLMPVPLHSISYRLNLARLRSDMPCRGVVRPNPPQGGGYPEHERKRCVGAAGGGVPPDGRWPPWSARHSAPRGCPAGLPCYFGFGLHSASAPSALANPVVLHP